MYRFLTAVAFAYVLFLTFPAHSYTTMDDVLSGRYAESQNFLDHSTDTHISVITGENVTYPRDSVTHCSGSGEDVTCINRTIKADPTGCPAGQVLITMHKYGNRSTVCVPE